MPHPNALKTPFLTPETVADRSSLVDLATCWHTGQWVARLKTATGILIIRNADCGGTTASKRVPQPVSLSPGHFWLDDDGILMLSGDRRQVLRWDDGTGATTPVAEVENGERVWVDLVPTAFDHFFLAVDRNAAGQERLLGLLLGESPVWWVIDDRWPVYRWPSLGGQDGTVVFQTWPLDQTPWSSSQLVTGQLSHQAQQGALIQQRIISTVPEGMFLQPQLDATGKHLWLMSNGTGVFQLFLLPLDGGAPNPITSLAEPFRQWDLADMNYGTNARDFVLDPTESTLLVMAHRDNARVPFLIDLTGGPVQEVMTSTTDFASLHALGQGAFLALGSAWNDPGSLQLLKRGPSHATCQAQFSLPAPDATLSAPQRITWSSDIGMTVSGMFYPASQQSRGQPAPLIVMIHSGPCKQVRATWPLKAHYFNQRGYGVFYINFRGSTGFGRAFWESLQHAWGERDAADVITGIRELERRGLASPGEVLLWAGDTGVWTLFHALFLDHEIAKAAIAVYGVTDLLDWQQRNPLQAPLAQWLRPPARTPEELSLRERIADLSHPLAMVIGGDDRVVGTTDYRWIHKWRQNKGLPTFWQEFPGVGHQWVRRDTIVEYYRFIDSFVTQVFPAR